MLVFFILKVYSSPDINHPLLSLPTLTLQNVFWFFEITHTNDGLQFIFVCDEVNRCIFKQRISPLAV